MGVNTNPEKNFTFKIEVYTIETYHIVPNFYLR